MFSYDKTHRLLIKREYDYVFENPKKINSTAFVVLYRINTIGHARLGLALSKKKIKKAHDRNRVKRIVREAFRKTLLPPIDIIFLAKNGAGTCSKMAIYEDVSKIWEQLQKL
jgi:ribonuclease P protein component